VSGRSKVPPEIIRDAGAEGDTAEPRELLDGLVGIENPLTALASYNEANALFESLYGEFGFLKVPAATNPLQPEERSRWVALLRWLLRELRGWRVAADPASRMLVAIFIVAQANDWDNSFWLQVPEDVGNNLELVQRLKGLLGSLLTDHATRGGMTALIWEVEAVEAFEAADRDGDWVGIASGLRFFEHQLVPRTILAQPVRCLYRCGISHLLEAVANLHQTVIALQVASALRVDERLRLVLRSDNPYMEFAGIYQTISGRHTAQQLSPADQQLVTQILLKVAADEPRWQAWMRVFNAFPMQYPALQAPLGAALAEAPEAAIGAYVDAIVLSVRAVKPPTPNPNRQCITTCLRRFKGGAPLDKRTLLWTKAHERWSAWDFDVKNVQTHLSSVSRSDLDYALVGFASECINDNDRSEVHKKIIGKLNALKDDWYISLMDIITRFHRILSRYQPYAHAVLALENGEDWLIETEVYWPFMPSDCEYFLMKYRLDLAG
jgi:hypothetical protein